VHIVLPMMNKILDDKDNKKASLWKAGCLVLES